MDTNCFLCGEIIPSVESLEDHILNAHGNVEQFKCESCGNEFESGDKLEVHMMVTHPEDEGEDVEEGEGEDEGEDEVDGGGFQFRWVKGYNHNNSNNPGILVVNEEARFALNKITDGGSILHYHCLKKATTKCKAKCTVEVDTVKEGRRTTYKVDRKTEIKNHNHVVDESDVIAADMVEEMHKAFRKDLTVKPSVVRKSIMLKYRAKYSDSETWKKIIDVLPDNASVDRGIARLRERVWGKIPLNRENLDYQKVLDNVEGGKIVEVLDSDKMWENKSFREQLVATRVLGENFEEPDDESVPENPLKRIIAFTSKEQLSIFENCEKGSVDGNFKVAPTHFSQVFVMMLKFGLEPNEKWVPVMFALLPSKDEIYYKLFFNMLKFELERRRIPIALKKLIVDFEISIQTSALSVFDPLVILGCYFHFAQCLLRKIQSNKMIGPYKNE